MKPEPDPLFVSFELQFEPDPPGTPASPRPPGRPRPTGTDPEPPGELVSMSPVDPDAAFAHELAERVLEYVQNRPAGLSAEQLAALVQQLLARRSA